MKIKKRTAGILCLSALALFVLGGIANGSYSNLGEKSFLDIVVFAGIHAALLVLGVLNIIMKDK